MADDKAKPEVFMFSRYGTETVGNHFIQLGILRAFFEACPDRSVYLLSSDVDKTTAGITGIQELLRRTPASGTLLEFIAGKVAVVGEDKIRQLGRDDLLILGGGPIMDDPDLAKWSAWFRWANRCGARTMILGCGLSPLRHPWAIALVKSMLAMTDVAVIRSQPRQDFVRGARSRLDMALDPAFLCLPFLAPLVREKRPLLALNARAIGFDSFPDRAVGTDEVEARVLKHALSISDWADIEGVLPFSTCETDSEPDSAISRRVADTLAAKLKIAARPLPKPR